MSKLSVLIIDDNEIDRELLIRDFKKAGLSVTVFEKSDGQQALDFFCHSDANRELYPEDFPPLLIFLDINMPVLDGFGFLERFATLRKELDVETCVVMMFTTSEAEGEREKALQYDFVIDYLVKGNFSVDDLKAKIASLSEPA